jgi:hypothetical protein
MITERCWLMLELVGRNGWCLHSSYGPGCTRYAEAIRACFCRPGARADLPAGTAAFM